MTSADPVVIRFQGRRTHKEALSNLMPTLQFEGEAYVLIIHTRWNCAKRTGPTAGNLAGRRDTIVAAMDFLAVGILKLKTISLGVQTRTHKPRG